MGGINCIAIANDQRTVLSVGQEKRLTYWDINNAAPVSTVQVDGEHDEAISVAM